MFLRRLRENSQPIAMLLAICTGLAAQYFFTGEVFTHQRNSNTWEWTTNFSVGLILLLMATGFAIWASFSRDKTVVIDDGIRFLTDEPRGRRVWMIIAGVCYLLSILIYLFSGENNLVRWLWMAGVGFLIIPLWLQSKGSSTAEDKVSTWEWILVGVISLIGFGLRYWKLTEIPSHVDNDVALMGTYALDLIYAGNYDWIGYSLSEHLLSYVQFQAWGMRLFGENHYGIVMHSVVLGTLSLAFVFLLARELGGTFTGFLAMGMLTISYTHIHFSRILFGNSASFAAILVVYALFKGIRTRESFWFAIDGTFVGLGLLLYDSSRVIPLIIVSVIIWQWLRQRQSFKSMYKSWAILIAGAILGFGPMLAYAIRNFSSFLGRTNTVALWTPIVWQHELASYNTDSAFVVLVQQTWRTFLTLHLTGDGSPHFALHRPMVSSLTALFFILGFGYALPRIKNIKYFAILGWIFLTFILGGVLTSDPPYWPHLNIALPAIVIIAALGAESLAAKLTTIFGRVGYQAYVWMLVGILIVTGLNNWQVYYDFVKNNAGNRIRIARYLTSLPSSYNVYMTSEAFNWNEHAFRFFSKGMVGQDLRPETLAADPPIIEHPTVFILFRHPEMVAALQAIYPDGVLENHYDFDNLVSFISYRVVPSTIDTTPESLEVSSLSSPGWQLIFAFIVFWFGYVAYNHYASVEDAVITQAGDGHSLKRRQRLVALDNRRRNASRVKRISRPNISNDAEK